MKEIQPDDIITENKVAFVKTLKEQTGYPHNLEPEQVVRLIYFFGARKLARKSIDVKGQSVVFADKFTASEKKALEHFFKWYGFATPDNRAFAAAYKALTARFKQLITFLRFHPAYITVEIYQALKTAGYEQSIKNIVLAIDKNRKIVPRLAEGPSKNTVHPLGKMETMLWNIQAVSLEKIQMILNSISVKDIKKATLGNKAKSLRDIYSMLHMVKQGNKNPNMTLINLNVNTAEPKDKLRSYSNYINKNRETK